MKLQIDLNIANDIVVRLFSRQIDASICDEAKSRVLNNEYVFSMLLHPENSAEIATISPDLEVGRLNDFLGAPIQSYLPLSDKVRISKLSLSTQGILKFYFEAINNMPVIPGFSLGKLGFFVSCQSDVLKAKFTASSIQCTNNEASTKDPVAVKGNPSPPSPAPKKTKAPKVPKAPKIKKIQ